MIPVARDIKLTYEDAIHMLEDRCYELTGIVLKTYNILSLSHSLSS